VVAERGHEDGPRLWLVLAEALEDFVAVEVRQADVGQDGVVSAQAGHGEGLLAIAGGFDDAAKPAEDAMRRPPDAFIGVGQENAHAPQARVQILVWSAIRPGRGQVLTDFLNTLLERPGTSKDLL